MEQHSKKKLAETAICIVLSVLSLAVTLFLLMVRLSSLPFSWILPEYLSAFAAFLAMIIPSVYLPFYRKTYPMFTTLYFVLLIVMLFIGFNNLLLFFIPAMALILLYGMVEATPKGKDEGMT